jgi:hypothetical protein
MVVTLERLETGPEGTFGRLWLSGKTYYTGELPFRDNLSSISCILPGRYKVAWAWSPRFRRHTYRLLGTDPRAGILVHSANLMGDRAFGFRSQLNGCIALGKKLGWIEGQKALLLSRPAVSDFEAVLNRQPFELEIVYV